MGSGGVKQGPLPPSAAPAIQAVNTPSVFEKAANDRLQNWVDFEHGPNAGDITQAPGMNAMIDIYGTADALGQKRRLSNPQMALSGGQSGDYANQLDSANQMQRYDQRAEGLSHAYQGLQDQAYGLGQSASTMEANRQQAYANDMLSQQESYYNRPRPKPLWERLAGLAIGGADAASKFL